MRNLAFAAVAATALVTALAACPEAGPSNPEVLWLDLDGSEIKVRLVEREPIPF